MRTLVAAALTVGLVAIAGPAVADDTTPPCGEAICCADHVCGPSDTLPPPPAEPVPDGPPRQPVVGLKHPSAPRGPGSDHRPCVSKREFRGLKNGWSRSETEGRLEVGSLGKRRNVIGIGIGFVYPRCGYDINEAWYAVGYVDGKLSITAAWKDQEATAHGPV